jgi:hypothetical protein
MRHMASRPYLAGRLSGCQRRGGRAERDDGIVMAFTGARKESWSRRPEHDRQPFNDAL